MAFRLIIVSVLVCFSSCMALYGIKKPRALDKEDLQRHAIRLGIPMENLYILDTGRIKKFYAGMKLSDPRTHNEILQPLQVRTYTASGENPVFLVNCNVGEYPLQWNRFGAFDIFPLQQGSFRRPARTISAAETFSFLIPVGKGTATPDLSANEETIIVFFAAFMGKHSNQLVKTVQDYRARFPEKKIGVYWVAVDELYL
jgi:hypothetical protein